MIKLPLEVSKQKSEALSEYLPKVAKYPVKIDEFRKIFLDFQAYQINLSTDAP